VESIVTLQGTKVGNVSEVPKLLATLIIRSMEVVSVFPSVGVSS